MRILLLGKNGQVGWELQRSLAPLGERHALDRHSTDYCGDLSKLEGLAQTVRALRPHIIVNAAAYTAVDRAESEPELAHRVNAQAPAVLAQERDRLTVINDQFGVPTGAELLADVTAHALRSLQNQPQHAGIYHLAAAGQTT